MSLAKLTSLSTQTLSLLLERQRLLGMGAPPPASSTQNIARNLTQLRSGILDLEASLEDSKGTAHGQGQIEAAGLLRNQFERMRGMLGSDGEALVEPYVYVRSLGIYRTVIMTVRFCCNLAGYLLV